MSNQCLMIAMALGRLRLSQPEVRRLDLKNELDNVGSSYDLIAADTG